MSSLPSSNSAAAALKSVLLMPTLVLADLCDKKKIEDFVLNFNSFKLINSTVKMNEGVHGKVWSTLRALSEGQLAIDTDPKNYSDILLTRVLQSLFNAPGKDATLTRILKLRMKVEKAGEIRLSPGITYISQWNDLIDTASKDDLPEFKTMRDTFVDGIPHLELRQRLKTALRTEDPKPKDMLTVGRIFIKKVRELETILSEAKAIAKTSGISSAGDKEITVASLTASVVAAIGKENSGAAARGASRGARRRAKKAEVKISLNSKVTKTGKLQTQIWCFGCGNKDHCRNNCPHENDPGFVKHPDKHKGKPI